MPENEEQFCPRCSARLLPGDDGCWSCRELEGEERRAIAALTPDERKQLEEMIAAEEKATGGAFRKLWDAWNNLVSQPGFAWLIVLWLIGLIFILQFIKP